MIISCMGKFDETVGRILLLCEKKRKRRTTTKSKVNKRSQSNRKSRAESVVIKNWKKKRIPSKGVVRHTCDATSSEKSESKTHKCIVDVIDTTGKIDNVSCSCSDFQSRFRYYRNKEGVGSWDGVKPIKDMFNPHTKEKPKVMNPDDEGYLCKHLIAFVNQIKK